MNTTVKNNSGHCGQRSVLRGDPIDSTISRITVLKTSASNTSSKKISLGGEKKAVKTWPLAPDGPMRGTSGLKTAARRPLKVVVFRFWILFREAITCYLAWGDEGIRPYSFIWEPRDQNFEE